MLSIIFSNIFASQEPISTPSGIPGVSSDPHDPSKALAKMAKQLCFSGGKENDEQKFAKNYYYDANTCCHPHWGPTGVALCWDAVMRYDICCQGNGARRLTYDLIRQMHNNSTSCFIDPVAIADGTVKGTFSPSCVIPFIVEIEPSEREVWTDIFLNVTRLDMCILNPVVSGRTDKTNDVWAKYVWHKAGIFCSIIDATYRLLFRMMLHAHAVKDLNAFRPIKLEQNFVKFGSEEIANIKDLRSHRDAYGQDVLKWEDLEQALQRSYKKSISFKFQESLPIFQNLH